ncbi:CocE/NonD family hydrolase [Actinomadura macra]|uniref:CocE/NonD family hydrolase n=1 Tax=Actinomadura macra TaxID=46164 RepID=UPI00082E0BB1|nr:CocE/NonD family hydrolase [Actinomadura macra]
MPLRKLTAAALSVLSVSVLGSPATAGTDDRPAFRSLYVRGDGTRLAVDVWLPPQARRGRVPTALRTTRYWRASDGDPRDPSGNGEAARWAAAGYALVLVDARGTGASFGDRTTELSDAEIADYGRILDWIAAQPWSTGRVGIYGGSYEGDTAELTVRLANPHLTAASPRFNDYDPYEDLVRPGGAEMRIIYDWLLANRALDGIDGAVCELAAQQNVPCEEFAAEFGRPRPVDGPTGPALAAAAQREHQRNLDLAQVMPKAPYRDDRVQGFSWLGMATATYRKQISRSRVPLLVPAGWLDAATANGALSRFLRFGNPQQVVLGPWNHGASHDADPFKPQATPVAPTQGEQFTELVAFFDEHVKRATRTRAKSVRYFTLAENRWRTTTVWPPTGTTRRTWHPAPGGALTTVRSAGRDHHEIDPNATTGPGSRWNTNLTEDDVVYPDRRAADRRLLTYTTAPTRRDLRVTGMPEVALRLAIDRPDADLHVYLEDVAPDGKVTYVTEGVLRLSNRAATARGRGDAAVRVPRTFARRDARPMTPNVPADVTIGLLSTSVLFKAGHRIRIAIAGADAHSIPAAPGSATQFTIVREASQVILPVAR